MPQRIIISASRRTDIPAFYMPWFMECIGRGWFEVVNPFNQTTATVPATVKEVHTIVFWSKDFGPFLRTEYGQMLQEMGYHLFFNFTINSPHRLLEPKVPPLQQRLDQLADLCQHFDPQSIQWRFDPICFFQDHTGHVHNNLTEFETITRYAANLGIRICVTSFVDLYGKVLKRLARITELRLLEPSLEEKVKCILKIESLLSSYHIRLRLCCEKEVLKALPPDTAVRGASCIPAHYLAEHFGPGISLKKDTGQRKSAGCGCSVSRDIGDYRRHPCHHNCLFCYANPASDVIHTRSQ